MKKRLIIVSNRVPVTIKKNKDGFEVMESAGGLVTAIKGFFESGKKRGADGFDEMIWVGSSDTSAEIWNKASNLLNNVSYRLEPVFIEKKQYDKYYNGFSNSTIWPLFHYFPSFAQYNSEEFEAYSRVNFQFFEKLSTMLQPGDILWIHDYHLMLLPELIRKKFPEVSIGFFLHIPFPAFEIFRIMPEKWKVRILSGLLGADLLGFHTIDYLNHFLKTLQVTLGLDNELGTIHLGERTVKADVFPISIDFEKFHNAFDLPAVVEERQSIRESFKDQKIIFSVDRLDYSKGILNRLYSFEYFLERFPEYQQKVVLILVIVPSRDIIKKYSERKNSIDGIVGYINGKFGTTVWQPIVYQYNHLNFEQLIAHYTACDLALITPIRDGMNLVSKEFVASRKDHKGALILSEMTGAAAELNEAFIINPTDKEAIGEKIKSGLELDEEEQTRRIKYMQSRVKQYDILHWADDFLTQLNSVKELQTLESGNHSDFKVYTQIAERYTSAQKRLLLLDYDGTLRSFEKDPQKAFPGKELLDLLEQLTSDTRNTVVIISGRDKQTLHEWLSANESLLLVAEHGAATKAGKNWESHPNIKTEWKDALRPLLENFEKRTTYSFIEEKEFSIAWHYRKVEKDLGRLRAGELLVALKSFLRGMELQIINGNKVIEVRNFGINKGEAALSLLKEKPYDFVMAIGDDKTDEDMFRVLNDEYCITIKVGTRISNSSARFYFPAIQNVLDLLTSLSGSASDDEEKLWVKNQKLSV